MTQSEYKRLLMVKKKIEVPRTFLSTSSTLLNLGCTGSYNKGLECGSYNLIAGTSSSGKTMLALSILAEAANNPEFDDYTLIYDGREGGAKMNFSKFFGSKMEKRVIKKDSPTVEDFYERSEDALKKGPCIIVLDSNDSLTTRIGQVKKEKNRQARDKGNKTTGSFNLDKHKYHSENLSDLVDSLRHTGSILCIVSQLRANLGAMPFEEQMIRPGGLALKFYADMEIWVDIRKTLKKDYKGKPRELGKLSRFRIRKNRSTGRDRNFLIPIYHSFGLDDVGSCVDYLLEESHWKKKGSKISAPEFDFVGSKEDLIRHIYDQEKSIKLKKITQSVYRDIEKALRVPREKRYQ